MKRPTAITHEGESGGEDAFEGEPPAVLQNVGHHGEILKVHSTGELTATVQR